MPRSIVFDCERMKYPHTGLYHFCWHLGRALWQQKGDDDLYYFLPRSAKDALGPVPVLLQHSFQKFFLPPTKSYQLWHCTYQGSHYFPAHRSIKKLTTVHDLNFLHDAHRSAASKKSLLKSLSQKLDASDAIVCISRFVQQELEQHLQVPAHKVQVIYNGCNIVDDVRPMQPKGLPGAPFFLSLGTVVPKKNFHVLPAAVVQSEYHLVLAGIVQDEGYLEKIRSEARRLGVAHKVHYLGPVTEAEKYWLLQNCSLFLFPSLAEGFGLPVIEAMHFGKPVVLSAATSLPEVGGEQARYLQGFEPEHVRAVSLQAVFDFSDEKSKATKDWAAQFRWENAARQYFAAYKKVLDA